MRLDAISDLILSEPAADNVRPKSNEPNGSGVDAANTPAGPNVMTTGHVLRLWGVSKSHALLAIFGQIC